MADPVDLFRYHDLTTRLSAFATDGGAYLRGDDEDLVVSDGEPAMREGESEIARIAGITQLIGSRSTGPDGEPSLGLVAEGGASTVVTSERLIMQLSQGASQLGTLDGREVHCFVLPWDLVSSISLPAKRSFSDRVAGARTISIASDLLFAQLTIKPFKRAQIGGKEVSMSDVQIADLLAREAAEHRLTVGPPDEHERLRAVANGAREVHDGDAVAWITDAHSSGVPSHLIGRLVERDEEGTAQG